MLAYTRDADWAKGRAPESILYRGSLMLPDVQSGLPSRFPGLKIPPHHEMVVISPISVHSEEGRGEGNSRPEKLVR